MTAVVLAGGENTRYPMPKGLMEVHGKRIIERQIEIFRSLGLEPVISTNTPETYGFLGVPMIADTIKRAGPVTGIISVFESTTVREILVTACDMPFIMPEMIEYIINNRGGEATLPCPGGRLEPLLAVYTREAAMKMKNNLGKGRAPIRELLKDVDTRLVGDENIKKIDPEGTCFMNINTPEDYARVVNYPPSHI